MISVEENDKTDEDGEILHWSKQLTTTFFGEERWATYDLRLHDDEANLSMIKKYFRQICDFAFSTKRVFWTDAEIFLYSRKFSARG